MHIHIGGDCVVLKSEVIGIFDLDNCSSSKTTRSTLQKMEQNQKIINIADDLPKAMVLCGDSVENSVLYFSQLNSATILKRAEAGNLSYIPEEEYVGSK